MNLEQLNNPLHGKTLEFILKTIVEKYTWKELHKMLPINCFTKDPSIKSSLKFLRKTEWARKRVEAIYIYGPPRKYFNKRQI